MLSTTLKSLCMLNVCAQKYVVPALSPPTDSELQQAQLALEAKYDQAAAMLTQLQEDTTQVKAALEEQNTKVDKTLEEVREAVAEFKVRDGERTEEMKGCKEEVDSIREMLPKVPFICIDSRCFSLMRISIDDGEDPRSSI